MNYIARITEEGDIQTIREHSENVANLSSSFSIEELKDLNYLIGLFHDIGKYQSTFQKRVNGENVAIEHSSCGAKEIHNEYKDFPPILVPAYCIIGHHTGIPNGGIIDDAEHETTLNGRLKRETEDYSFYKEDLKDLIEKTKLTKEKKEQLVNFLLKDCNNSKEKLLNKFAFITRYCFSCLVDADSLDAASFSQMLPQKLKTDFHECLKKVNKYLKDKNLNAFTKLQKTRSKIQSEVFSKRSTDSEIYLMNMPTGSGKTLCSVKYALEKAIKNNKERVIYVIPYNSIIDQTASVLESIFGESADILRHQSTFLLDEESSKEEIYNVKLATENWNADFIITTTVQFFESIYSNKRGKLRKLHNMQNSIIVFDEVQLMPQKLLQPCLEAIFYLSKYFNNEILFLTATMPNYRNLFDKFLNINSKSDLQILDLNKIDDAFLNVFRKCEYNNLGTKTFDSLLNDFQNEPSLLIVVNKRATAREFYNMLGGKKYHLSTYMTAYDRKRVISEIKNELSLLKKEFKDIKDIPKERQVKVVSTSLIEAGVDLDFYTVYREISGLDSILQAGGRCNREGSFDNCNVYVFKLADKEKASKDSDKKKFNDLDIKISVTSSLLDSYGDNIDSKECIEKYYDEIFEYNKEGILKKSFFCDDNNKSCSLDSARFRSYSEEIFKIIDDRQLSIIVPQDKKSRELVEKLRIIGENKLKMSTIDIVRKLQVYACSIYPNEFEKLRKEGALEDHGTGIWYLTNIDYYDHDIGIKFEGLDYIV